MLEKQKGRTTPFASTLLTTQQKPKVLCKTGFKCRQRCAKSCILLKSCGRTLLRPTHRAGSNAARNVQRLLKKCARDWNGCAAKKIPVSSNRYFFAGRAGAMESPTRAVVEPAVRRREATKARVAPKQIAACGYLPSLLSQTRTN